MWLLVGLGNPGPEYAATRHNIGFMAIDALADSLRAGAFTKKFHGELAEARVAEEKILLLRPQTFMNLSGKSVQAALSFYKIPTDRLIVLHDELDLPPGKMRIKRGGGTGGHNGLKDIDRLVGADYWRVRLGIGHPGRKEQVHGYVLGAFSGEERAATETWLQELARHFPLFWNHSPQTLMSKMHSPVA